MGNTLQQGASAVSRGINNFADSVSDIGDEFSAKKLELVGSTFNPLSDDRKGFSPKELEAEFQKEIEPEAGTLTGEEVSERRSDFYKRKQKELEEIEDKEPKRDYSEFKPAAQEKSSPYAVRTDVQIPTRRGFQDIDPRGYNQIQRGLGIVDLNKLLDEAMGTRAQMNVFNSLFGGGRGLL
jgi:hypothetical protein